MLKFLTCFYSICAISYSVRNGYDSVGYLPPLNNEVLHNEDFNSSPMFNTTSGPLRGLWGRSQRGKLYAAFKGIPYAQPPVGPLRFEPPQEAAPWKGVWFARKHGPQCPQYLFVLNLLVGHEDCLYLNVYVPQHWEADGIGNGMPIIFFIHGGSFTMGSGDMDDYLYGPDLLMDENVILVTINYRLGALGFLYLSDLVPGNMGLKDQQMALKWVRKNARVFGGDPDRIVVMGESAGAASAQYQLLNQQSQKWIFAAIAQSGTALAPWAWTRPCELKQRTVSLAISLRCPNLLEPKKLSECLKQADYKEIVSKQFGTDLNLAQIPIGVSFTPTTEPRGTPGGFLESCPRDILSDERRVPSHIPYMTGYNTNEGEFFVKVLMGVADPLIKWVLTQKLGLRKNSVDNLLQSGLSTFQALRKYVDVSLGEFEIRDPVIHSSRFHAKAGANVYLYNFDFNGRNNFNYLFFNSSDSTHMDELTYLFQGRGLFSGLPALTDDTPEAKVSQKMIRMWTDFAKTGKPAPKYSSESDVLWPRGTRRLLVIGERNTIGDTPAAVLWNALLAHQCSLS